MPLLYLSVCPDNSSLCFSCHRTLVHDRDRTVPLPVDDPSFLPPTMTYCSSLPFIVLRLSFLSAVRDSRRRDRSTRSVTISLPLLNVANKETGHILNDSSSVELWRGFDGELMVSAAARERGQ
ncbi:hypothetical protein ACFE04_023758 [Oxalis oulophora]